MNHIAEKTFHGSCYHEGQMATVQVDSMYVSILML